MIFRPRKQRPRFLVLDLDGVFTDGKFIYGKEGKEYKAFGPDDHDALRMMSRLLHIHVVTADARGFEISRKRIVDDMEMPLSLIDAKDRPSWIVETFEPKSTIYMGDGIFDYLVFEQVSYGIATSDALKKTRKKANFVTSNKGGERAVAEACVHIAKKFFDTHL